ncbi:hypothetical protein MG9_03571 [Candida albicans P37037]|nr:hypothetical protein MG9_03571 [Candida albicans P37037]
MTIINVNPGFFYELTKLPSEVIALILGLLPKCMLPELLYFPPIKEIVISTIFSNVSITYQTERHRGNDGAEAGYWECDCHEFCFTLVDLLEGIKKWNIYPRSIHIHNMDGFQNEPDTFVELLKKASSIHGTFYQNMGSDQETQLDLIVNSNIKFDHLNLSRFSSPLTLPPIATSIRLNKTILNNYAIPGVKKLSSSVKSDDERNQMYAFSSDLEDLHVFSEESIQMTLPPNLRKLNIEVTSGSVGFISEEMVNLEYLSLKLPNIQSFDKTGINAPNLKKLVLECESLSNFDGLKQFPYLKHLEFSEVSFSMSLFDDGSFSELDTFICWGCDIQNTVDFDSSLLTFPSNLKTLELSGCSFENTDFSNWVPPGTLETLRVYDSPLKYGFLGANLRYFETCGSRLTFDSNFRIFPMVEKFILNSQYVTFESPDFMYHLPNNLVQLHLASWEQGKMGVFTQMVKWPLMLTNIIFHNFNINNQTLEFLNFKESRLEEINIRGGNVNKLDADLFPTSVKYLTLREMKIQELSDSFENLENLRRLSLARNQLKMVNPVKLPVSTLQTLDLKQCNVRFISPFLVSMLEEKNKNPKLHVYATENSNISVIDIRTALKLVKGLVLFLNDFDKSLTEISRRSSRLICIGESRDPHFENYEFSATEEVVPDYDPDDLYDGSDASSDEEDTGDDTKRRREM